MGSRSSSRNSSTTDTNATQNTAADQAIIGDGNSRSEVFETNEVLDLSDRSVTDLSDRSVATSIVDTSQVNDESFTYETFSNSEGNTETNDNRDFSTLDASSVDNSTQTTTISSFSEDNSQLNFTDSSDQRTYVENLSDDVAIAAINSNAMLAAQLSAGNSEELRAVTRDAQIANVELTSKVLDFVDRSNSATGDFIGGILTTADETVTAAKTSAEQTVDDNTKTLMIAGAAAGAILLAFAA